MTAQSVGPDQKRTQERNQKLAQRTVRWSRFRLAFAVIFLLAGCAIATAFQSLAISFPLFGLSVLFLILFLDANGQVREIRRRNWKTLHPVSRIRAHPTDGTFRNPPNVEAPQPPHGA